MNRFFAIACVLLTACVASSGAQTVTLDRETRDRIARAIRTAFAPIVALPRDSDAAELGTWVLDTRSSRLEPDETGEAILVATRHADTGDDLRLLEEMTRAGPGTTARQMQAAAAAMQQIEGRISKAEADASLEVRISVNPALLSIEGLAEKGARHPLSIPEATVAMRVDGTWRRVVDRDMDVAYERWSPATAAVAFGAIGELEASPAGDGTVRLVARARPATDARVIRVVTVTLQGNEEMVLRVAREADWQALAALVPGLKPGQP